jgi:hypothetical protein
MRGLAEIIPLRTGDCRDASCSIPQIAAGEDTDVDPRHATHVGACLRCQAEVAAYRRVLRAMQAMHTDGTPPSSDEVASILSAINQHNWAIRMAYVGGITVATAAAGAAGVLVWIGRRRLAAAS